MTYDYDYGYDYREQDALDISAEDLARIEEDEAQSMPIYATEED